MWLGNTLLHLAFRAGEGGGVVRKQPLHLAFHTREGIVWLKKHPPLSCVSYEGGDSVVKKHPPPSCVSSEGGVVRWCWDCGVVRKHPPLFCALREVHNGEGGARMMVVWLKRSPSVLHFKQGGVVRIIRLTFQVREGRKTYQKELE